MLLCIFCIFNSLEAAQQTQRGTRGGPLNAPLYLRNTFIRCANCEEADREPGIRKAGPQSRASIDARRRFGRGPFEVVLLDCSVQQAVLEAASSSSSSSTYRPHLQAINREPS